MIVHTIGHGRRSLEELIALVRAARVETLIDVRRYPGSRRNPQFNRVALAEALEEAGIGYRHEVELGGRLSGEAGEERFGCIRIPAFASYAARMGSERWQAALAASLELPKPCFMCAETLWTKCHRRLIAELLDARGYDVRHLSRPGKTEPHVRWSIAEVRDGRLYLCGQLVS